MPKLEAQPAEERTRDVYEKLASYPSPPEIAVADIDDPGSYREAGLPPGTGAHALAKLFFKAMGFSSFCERLVRGKGLSACLRRADLRYTPFPQPTTAASIVLSDGPSARDPFERAASLVVAAKEFHDDFRAGRILPDTLKGHALEMAQYANLFSTNLIYERGKFRWFRSARARTVTVVHNGRFYICEIEREGFPPATVGQLKTALQELAQRPGPPASSPFPLGLLSSASYPSQKPFYRKIVKDGRNASALADLRNSFLTICLDADDHPQGDPGALFSSHNTHHLNRNFNASFQIVVFGNAKAGAICHFGATLDGNVMMRAGAELVRRASALLDRRSDAGPRESVRPLAVREISLHSGSEGVGTLIRDVQACVDNQRATFRIPFGKGQCASSEIDPVAVFVISLVKSVFDIENRISPVQQILALSKYACLGVIDVDLTTPEVGRFIEGLSDPKMTAAERKELLREAIRSQNAISRKKRDRLDLGYLFRLFLGTRKPLKKLYVVLLWKVLASLTGQPRLFREPREILISHAAIERLVPLLGRPGTRLPYLRRFGLHYQIHAEETWITFMPGLLWRVSNSRLAAVLEENLKKIVEIARS